jgi:hypothetical protein
MPELQGSGGNKILEETMPVMRFEKIVGIIILNENKDGVKGIMKD